MASVEIIGTGRLDERDSAFPQAAQLPNGDILCSFSVGGSHSAKGGTDWARSTDGGETWELEGTLLPQTSNPATTNALKLSISPDGGTVYAYGFRSYPSDAKRFGEGKNEAVFCRSTDGGKTWSQPEVVPFPVEGALEVSHGILPLSSGRLLAPTATLPEGRLGEQVIAAVSEDGGKTWPKHVVVFQDPEERFGYFEQKLAEISPGHLIATCWTVTFGDTKDQPDSFALSHDDGLTWGPPRPTEFMGQTMTPIPLGGDRLLVVYNKRYGQQGVMMALVTFSEEAWTTHFHELMWDPRRTREKPTGEYTGVEELSKLEFGFPTAIRLQDGTFLATHWSYEDGVSGIRWTKLRVDW
ncbi:MAG: sialidase family protein [Chloroflexi bacterium]|nr:sialidase family protein [Chloroflexota bacterium]